MTNMNSIFDIEEKSNKKIDRDYLISNGWSKRVIGQLGVVYEKTIKYEKRHSLFVSFYYHYKDGLLHNGYTREEITVNDVTDLELIAETWEANWRNRLRAYFIL